MSAVIRTAALLLVLVAAPLQAAEWTVRPGESIAAAIAAAAPGDTVRVERGRYVGNLVIDKPLTLRGVDRPTLSAELVGDPIRIEATDVVIEGLIITDSGTDLNLPNAGIQIRKGADRAVVRDCDLVYNLFGLYIEGVEGVVATGNRIMGKRDLRSVHRGNGIQLYNTRGARIEHNRVGFVRDAIYVDVSHGAVFRHNRLHHSRYGAHYMNSNDNVWEYNESYRNRGGLALMEVRNQTVRGNRAWGNSDHGIMLRTIQDSLIEDNVVEGNARGFFIYDAEYNVLRGNRVIRNQVGVHLWAGSVRNEVERNDFIGNREQVRYVASRDQIWGREHGNYWSNYLGWDRDADGVGDVPYEANDVVDRLSWRHPMMKLLLSSPAVDTLRLVSRQFPLLRAPSIVDPNPRMRPWTTDPTTEWSEHHVARND